jgi:hypothetical protein
MTQTTIQGLTGDVSADALFSGVKWSGSVTYSFPTSPAAYSDYTSPEPSDAFIPVSVFEQTEINWIYSSVTSFTGFSITLDPSGGDIRIAHSVDANPTSYTYYPGDGSGGDVWFGEEGYQALDTPQAGDYAWLTHIHEAGHSLGLKHPFELAPTISVVLPADHDALEYTVMTYRSTEYGSTLSLTDGPWDYPQTYMMDDIHALQAMYGADFSKVGTSITYSWNPLNGTSYENGVAWITPGGDRIFETIWDAGAHATFDLSNYTTDQNIDLRPGYSSIVSQNQLAHVDAVNDILAHGNIYNALEFGDNPASLISDVKLGSGTDVARGNAGDNSFTLGSGHDTLVFDTATGHDTVIGFSHADTIDLSNIPSMLDFSEVNLSQVGSDTLLTLPDADGTVLLKGINDSTLTAADFVYAPPPPPTITSFDIAGDPGFLYRLYQAAFDRAPDTEGLTFNLHLLETGLNHDQMASAFAASPEFTNLHGDGVACTDVQFVTALYEDVLHRAPDAPGLAGWDNYLASGVDRGSVLIGFSESVENHAMVDPHLKVTGITLDPAIL